MYSKIQKATFAGDFNDFTRFDVSNVFSADDIKSTGLRGNHPGFVEPAQSERSESLRVTGGDNRVFGQEEQGIGSLEPFERVAYTFEPTLLFGDGGQVQDNLAVRGRLEDGAFGIQICFEFKGVGQVTVVRHGQRRGTVGHHKRLNVEDRGRPGGAVTSVANSHPTGQGGYILLQLENFRDLSHALE